GVIPAKVLALAQGGMKALLLTRLQVGAVLLVAIGLVCASAGISLCVRQAPGEPPGTPVMTQLMTAGVVPAAEDHTAASAAPEDDGDDWPEVPGDHPADTKGPGIGTPPALLHCDPFYKKYLSAHGIPVLSSEKVSDRALQEAAYLINHVLEERPD